MERPNIVACIRGFTRFSAFGILRLPAADELPCDVL